MSDISLPIPVLPCDRFGEARSAVLLALDFVAALGWSELKNVAAYRAHSLATFSLGFDVSRTVCGQSALVRSEPRERITPKGLIESPEYLPMKPSLTAALVAGIGFTTTSTAESPREIKVIASEVARRLIGGIVLGANVEPYLSGLLPADIESRVTASGYAPAPTTDPPSNADE
jgi:hypothetical protein